MKNFIITEELANRILNYLAQRPFIEVAPLIQELQQIKLIEESAEKTDINNNSIKTNLKK